MNLDKRIDHLHIIRGVASLLVVIFHARFILWCGGVEFTKLNHPILEKGIAYCFMLLFSSGGPMVICFFVLSGFFIQLSYENNTIGKFYFNRFIRIYIPYIANTLITCLIFYTCFSYINPHLKIPFDSSKEIANTPLLAFKELNIKTFLKSLIFLPNKEYIGWNNQYWSLLYEGIFYLTIPLLVYKKIFILVIAFLTFIIGFFYFPEYPFYRYVIEYLIFFQVGVCLHLWIDLQLVKNVFNKRYTSYIIICCIIIYFILNILQLMNHPHIANLLGGVLAVTSIFLLYHQPDIIVKKKIYKWLEKLGKISFSLYLNHMIILYVIYAVITRFTGIYIIYEPFYILIIPFVIGFSYVFYALVEKQSLRLKKYFDN